MGNKFQQNIASGSTVPLQSESTCYSVDNNSNAHTLEKDVKEPLEGMIISKHFLSYTSISRFHINNFILSLSQEGYWFVFPENFQQEPPQQDHVLEEDPPQQEHVLDQDPPQQEHGLEDANASTQASTAINVKRRSRGPTKCLFGTTIEGIALPEIQFNERGQPIGPHSEKFSSFLGVLAREILGIKHMEWKKVSEVQKKDMWSAINVSINLF